MCLNPGTASPQESRHHDRRGETALGVGDGVIASLPVMTAGNGIRNSVLGPNGAHNEGSSGFGRSDGVETGRNSSSNASSASLSGVPFFADAARSVGKSSIVRSLGRRVWMVETVSAKSFSPVHSPTSSVRSSYPFAATMWVLNRCASVLERSVRGALNWLTQNLVSAQWLSRYLDCGCMRWEGTCALERWLTSRKYDGMSVVSTSMRGVEEKHVGFDSAAVAIITDDAPGETVRRGCIQASHLPVSLFTRFASSHPLQSPFSMTAMSTPRPCTNWTMSPSLFTTAASRCRMFLVRQCTVNALTPVLMILSTSFFVSSWVGSRRIFAETVI